MLGTFSESSSFTRGFPKPKRIIAFPYFRGVDVKKAVQMAKQAQMNGTHIIVVAFKEGGKLKSLEKLEAVRTLV